MDPVTFRQAATLLSGEYSIAILKALRDGRWHLASEMAHALDIHVSTASRFLQRLAELGIIERRPHDSRTSEFRIRTPYLRLELDLLDDSAPLREAVDFYVSYFQSLFERIRNLGATNVEGQMESRLSAQHEELRRAVFEHMLAGSQGGLDRLRELMAALHRDLWTVCSGSTGTVPAKKVFQGALEDAIATHPDLAIRCGLARPLEE
jgi:DNA-binding MarR family transcriptional regulator